MLVWLNVASVALYIVSGALLLRRRNSLAMLLVFGEVVVHAVTASLLLGWDTGFHYYLLTMIGPLAVGMKGKTLGKLVRLLAFGVLYSALDWWTRQVPSTYQLEPIVVDVIRLANIAGMFAVTGLVALTYAGMISATEGTLQTLASTDPLTGLNNRRHFLELVRSVRAEGLSRANLYVLLCDIDRFKEVNDRHGHEAGDLVLEKVAGAIKGAVRTEDSVARWGGEEFVVLMPSIDLACALQTAERIRCGVEGLKIHPPGVSGSGSSADELRLPIPLTITIGVARVEPANTIHEAIARADDALYHGKAAGRNQVIADGGWPFIPSTD